MKKTLLALSVLVASSAANAGIEVYNKDGASVTLAGDIEVKYVAEMTDDTTTAADETDLTQYISDADFSFDVRYAVNDDLSVGGVWKFEGDQGGTVDVETKTADAYVAFYTADMGTLIVGDTVTMLDDAGVGSDQIFGISTLVDNFDVGGDELVKYTIDKDSFYFGVAYMDNKKGDDDVLDFKAGFRAGDLDVTAFYGTSDSADIDIAILEARYALGAVNLEAGYYTVEDSNDTIAIAADYTIDKWTFAAGINDTDYDAASAEDFTGYFVNASYAIATSTTLYVEVAGNDKDDTDTGYGFGAEMSF
jgi:predicted porin